MGELRATRQALDIQNRLENQKATGVDKGGVQLMEHDATCIQSQSSFTVVILYHFNPLTERYMFDLQKKQVSFAVFRLKTPFPQDVQLLG